MFDIRPPKTPGSECQATAIDGDKASFKLLLGHGTSVHKGSESHGEVGYAWKILSGDHQDVKE